MQIDSADDKRTVSALAKLLRDELRDARFSVAHLARADVEFVPSASGGGTTTTLEETSKKELDAAGLKALHDTGAWKRDLFRSNIRVETLGRFERTAARTGFECLLDDLGVLSDGHVTQALGAVLHRHDGSQWSVGRDCPSKSIGFSESVDLWSFLLVDACLGTPRHTAAKVLHWVRGAPLAFETRVLLGRLNAASSFTLASGLAVERLPRKSKGNYIRS